MKNIALLTSAITPQGDGLDLKVVNPSERLEQYLGAYRFYIRSLKDGVFDNLIYVDNSGYPLDEFMDYAKSEGVADNVECVSYTSTIKPKHLSRFFLELNLLNYGIEHSATLRKFPEAIVWKITGRYTIKNIASIIGKVKQQATCDVYLNFRNYPERWSDFYLAGFTVKAYNDIFQRNTHIYESTASGETILRDYLDNESNHQYTLCQRLPVTPLINGKRGLDGSEYGKGKDLIKYYLRRVALVIIPFIWV